MDPHLDASTVAPSGPEVLALGMESLSRLLGPDWEVTARPEGHGDGDRIWDATLQVKSSDGSYVQLMVDVKDTVTPLEVKSSLLRTANLVHHLSPYTKLIVFSAWISPRAQEELRSNDIGYLDLTGNIFLRVGRPAIVLHMQGADRAPRSMRTPAAKPLLTGTKAGRLVRLLADVAPPYRANELSQGAGLSLPYVSRLLDTLEDQLLIRRKGRVVASVDWAGLLRARAEHLDLLRQNSPQGMIALNGIKDVLNRVTSSPRFPEVFLTGSYAARELAPLAVGGQLMLYVHGLENLDQSESLKALFKTAREFGLMPTDEGADVLLLQAPDPFVFARARENRDIPAVAISQLALDCLSGPGRMPAEGEKVLEYMANHESDWRSSDLSTVMRTRMP